MSAGSLDSARAGLIAAEFPAIRERVYLNTAAEGLGSATMARALARYATDKQRGSNGREAMADTSAATKTHLARWLGCTSQDVAFFGSTSDAIGAVLRGLPWKTGDNLVITDLEFPSAMIGALSLERQYGIDVRLVRHTDGWIDTEAIIDRIDHSTRLVILSHVSFHSGLRFDVDSIATATHASGAKVLVDASQSLGAIPVRTGEIDFLVACAFKWLLASHGAALLYVRPGLDDPLPHHLPGWRGVTDFLGVMQRNDYTSHAGAERYESGMPGYPAIYTLHDALQFLETLDPPWIHNRVRALATRVYTICADCGLSLLTPEDPNHRAGIVSFTHANAGDLGAALSRRGIDTWYRDGRVRLSPHIYVADDQLTQLESELANALDQLEAA